MVVFLILGKQNLENIWKINYENIRKTKLGKQPDFPQVILNFKNFKTLFLNPETFWKSGISYIRLVFDLMPKTWLKKYQTCIFESSNFLKRSYIIYSLCFLCHAKKLPYVVPAHSKHRIQLLKAFIGASCTPIAYSFEIFCKSEFSFLYCCFFSKKISTLGGKKTKCKRRVLEAPKVVKTVLGKLRNQSGETFWISTI